MENEKQELKESKDIRLVVDNNKLERYLEELKLEQNFLLAVIGALLAALLGAVAWAAITVVTNFQIGFMAVAVGFLVGFLVRVFGRGIDKIFAIVGAVFSFLGCLLGNFLSLVAYLANAEGLGYFEVLMRIDYSLVPGLMLETFSPIDLVFYGIAIYEGYKFSFRKITEEEIISHASKEVMINDAASA